MLIEHLKSIKIEISTYTPLWQNIILKSSLQFVHVRIKHILIPIFKYRSAQVISSASKGKLEREKQNTNTLVIN